MRSKIEVSAVELRRAGVELHSPLIHEISKWRHMGVYSGKDVHLQGDTRFFRKRIRRAEYDRPMCIIGSSDIHLVS